ncbi:MAG: acyltransferase [Deltaproteobacteria bacterium]|nr:acyltransferase [Deltaproteobacteria bacterium]
MFGTFRYLLALLVVLIHVWPGFMLWTGVYAVFAFYALSGYLMALVLDRSYEPTRAGTLRYFANRGLRIYPPYFAALVLAAVIGLMDPVTARNIGQIHPPENALEWLRNLFIFTLHLERAETNRLISLAWSVDIELWFYVAMGLGLGRGRYRIAIWFLLSLAYTVFMVAEGYPFPPRYSTIAAASLPYSLGALLYSQQGHLRQFLSSRWHAPLAFALFFVNAVFSPSIWGNPFITGFYASLAVAGYAIASLGVLQRASGSNWLARLDGIAGNLSYPVFLCHLPVAAMLVSVGIADEYGLVLLLWTIPATSLAGWVIHGLTQSDIDALRDRVRGVARAATSKTL